MTQGFFNQQVVQQLNDTVINPPEAPTSEGKAYIDHCVYDVLSVWQACINVHHLVGSLNFTPKRYC